MKSSLSLLCLLLFPYVAWGQGLTRLPYNHPGLQVDLGVGLWAWPVPCDADGDGDYDLIVSCPDKPSNGVWLFINDSGDTSVNKMPTFRPATRLSSTVHYVMPSYVDGKLYVLTPGFSYPHFLTRGLQDRLPLPVPANFYRPAWNQPKGPKVRHNQWRYVDFDGDGALDLVTGIEDWSEYGWDDAFNAKGEWTNGPLHGFVLLHRNEGTTEEPKYASPVKVMAGDRPIDVFGCPSPNFGDFDLDGDLDLICGEFLDGFTYFENTGTRTAPVYAPGRQVLQADGSPLKMDLEMIVPVAFDWDKDGDLDLIVGDEDGRVAFVENVTPEVRPEQEAKPTTGHMPLFAAPRYFQQEADTLKCGALATPYAIDWDADGDIDIISGNTAGYIEIFENLSGRGIEQPKWAAPRRLQFNSKVFRVMAGPNGSIQGPAEAKWGYTTLNVADWDGDGLNDILFNSILGRVQWLKNMGTREVPEFTEATPVTVEWTDGPRKPAWTWWEPEGNALVTQWRTTPVVHDFTGDGLPDLAMLDHEGFFVLFERTRRDGALVLLPPRRLFTDRDGKPLQFNNRKAGGSGRRKLAVVDWDGDGNLDILLNSTNADLYRGLGQVDGQWRFEHIGSLAQQNIEGHDVSPAIVDFNADGIPDFLGGAEDGRFYYLRNPRTR
ncbi:FG-GAP repeat domain-containing protein [Schlesneria sp.]|uniref:FG-GAP repeat domain-containing protein n=1 Tax=Schlesneria sp. TaxID=2762018 RepID=UPI002F145576